VVLLLLPFVAAARMKNLSWFVDAAVIRSSESRADKTRGRAKITGFVAL